MADETAVDEHVGVESGDHEVCGLAAVGGPETDSETVTEPDRSIDADDETVGAGRGADRV